MAAQTICPKTRFGKTELQISMVTCGGMRLQQSWGRGDMPAPERIEDVDAECQANLVAIIRAAVAKGINHFETAQGYGCSEVQFGQAFKELFASGELKREDVIIQTKVGPKATPEEFQAALEKSFQRLQVNEALGGYIDLFGFHGINRDHHVGLVCDTLMPVVDAFRAAGRIRHVGFSTHGMPRAITRAINSGKFDYVNLHFDFIGSYTASGSGPTGGNLQSLKAAAKHDMGIFIISPYDKGGKLYKPPTKFARICAGTDGLSPIAFNSLWLWTHDPAAHTLVVGAARPGDFDEAVSAACLYGQDAAAAKARCGAAASRLTAAAEEVFGREWVAGWHTGLPDCYEAGGPGAVESELDPMAGADGAALSAQPTGAFVCYMVWLHLLVKSWGFLEFAQARFGELEGNAGRWEAELSFEENTKGWGFCPGTCIRQDLTAEALAPHLASSMDPKLALTAVTEAYAWLNKATGGAAALPSDGLRADCAPAFDLQPDVPYPERADIKDPQSRR